MGSAAFALLDREEEPRGISGKLVINEKDPDRLMPINWMQAISVYMAIKPDTKPDWSNGMKLLDTVQGSLLVANKLRIHWSDENENFVAGDQ